MLILLLAPGVGMGVSDSGSVPVFGLGQLPLVGVGR
jgi:hypothetical protein